MFERKYKVWGKKTQIKISHIPIFFVFFEQPKSNFESQFHPFFCFYVWFQFFFWKPMSLLFCLFLFLFIFLPVLTWLLVRLFVVNDLRWLLRAVTFPQTQPVAAQCWSSHLQKSTQQKCYAQHSQTHSSLNSTLLYNYTFILQFQTKCFPLFLDTY